jgi:hypothetical protein
MDNCNDTQTEIEIERGIPMPKRRTRTKYPYASMRVHDSVWVTGPRPNTRHWKRATGFSFKTQAAEKMIDNATVMGWRIWRTA